MHWNIAEAIGQEAYTKHPDIDPVILQLLHNRGMADSGALQAFLHPQYEDLHDPFLFSGMQALMDRLRRSKAQQERVFVYGDYDADGVCSTALMREALKLAGFTDVGIYIPHREQEGYGLNTGAIDYLAAEGCALIITVDCGTSNAAEVAYAREKQIDVAIIDHHEGPPALPENTVSLLNPHCTGETYPFKHLAAVGVVFKTVQAIWKTFQLPPGQEKWFLDLVAIATVADMMPLLGENRTLVTYGLTVLNKTRRAGLRALIESLGEQANPLGVYDIGFKIGPRLNAAGRLGHANTAYKLLAVDDERDAVTLAAGLNSANSSRQAETERMLTEAMAQVEPQAQTHTFLAAVEEGWTPGVVGLVSGKITEKFWRPSVVIAKTEKGMVGSGRSIPGFNITEALKESSEYLARFGGHEGACGFTLKQDVSVGDFVEKLNQIAERKLSKDDLAKRLKVDMELVLEKIDFELAEKLQTLAPFGIGNPTPVFATKGARVDGIFLMGPEGQHMKLKLRQKDKLLTAVGFGFGANWHDVLNVGDMVDVAYQIDINEWNGKREVQLKLTDIKKT